MANEELSYDKLLAGHEFTTVGYQLTTQTVTDYVRAVGDPCPLHSDEAAARASRFGGLVAPPTVAALFTTLRVVLDGWTLPDGTIHTRQYFGFSGALRPDESYKVSVKLADKFARRERCYAVLESTVRDSADNTVVVARTTGIWPGDAGKDDAETGNGGRKLQQSAPPGEGASSLQCVERQVSQQTIDRYAEASGDFNPLHVDAEFARTTRFGRTIAHGMMTLAFMSQMMTLNFGDAWIDSGEMEMNFLAPVFPGDTITAGGVSRSNDQGNGATNCEVYCINQDGRKVLAGAARLRDSGRSLSTAC